MAQIHRYNYKSVHGNLVDELTKKINEQAKKGWRLVNVTSAPGFNGFFAFLEQDRISGR